MTHDLARASFPLGRYALLGPLGALAYRAANTLDSRVGYHGKFEWFGKPSARLDDLLNLVRQLPSMLRSLVTSPRLSLASCYPKGRPFDTALRSTPPPQAPARLTALGLAAAALVSAGCDGPRGLRIAWRDVWNCESPNAGWPMATMAGLLGVRLEKAKHYHLGDPTHALTPRTIHVGVRAAQLAGGLAVLLASAASALRAPL